MSPNVYEEQKTGENHTHDLGEQHRAIERVFLEHLIGLRKCLCGLFHSVSPEKGDAMYTPILQKRILRRRRSGIVLQGLTLVGVKGSGGSNGGFVF